MEIVNPDSSVLIYQDLEDLVDAVSAGNPKIQQFDCSVFDGNYVTGDIDEGYLDRLERSRNDASKSKEELEGEEQLSLHNAD